MGGHTKVVNGNPRYSGRYKVPQPREGVVQWLGSFSSGVWLPWSRWQIAGGPL